MAVVWTGDQKSVEDDRNGLAVAGPASRPFPFIMLPASKKPGGAGKLGGGTARTGDLS